MKFLLTNDDGIEAPGLKALERLVAGFGHGGGPEDRLVIAPSSPASGISHATTTDGPLRVNRLGARRHSVDGTPADCVRVALHRHAGEFDWVLAGVNNGGNLGIDVYHSGTVAAVREAAIHGLPGIAISHYHNHPLGDADWERAIRWAGPVIEDLIARPWLPGQFWNVNLPAPDLAPDAPEVVHCSLDPSPLVLSFREEQDLLHYDGRYSLRPRRDGMDVDVCFGGRIVVTRMGVHDQAP
ncbi:MAG: 5'/3'-nucleotidase SurE [Acidobacteria bacterium]|nr:5'/3'-nucleotidase SurE [Acidobacteriota bacterium]